MLTVRRNELEGAVLSIEREVTNLKTTSATPDNVRSGLANFSRVFAHLKPFEQQELIRLVLRRAEVGDRAIVLEVYKEACAGFAQASKSASRFEPPVWLPDEDSNLEHRG